MILYGGVQRDRCYENFEKVVSKALIFKFKKTKSSKKGTCFSDRLIKTFESCLRVVFGFMKLT